MSEDRNCLSWWLPRLVAAGLPTPDTRVVGTHVELWSLLDGELPPAWDQFMFRLERACDAVAPYPVFLRTGHTSGKHRWASTCHVRSPFKLAAHVGALVEESAATFPTLPVGTWAARRMLETAPLFRAFEGMPVTREFRLFAEGDSTGGTVTHAQPYWPEEAVAQGRPDRNHGAWRRELEQASEAAALERDTMARLARDAAHALGGAWSIDLLQDTRGEWWVTDCAEAERSFRYDPPAHLRWPGLADA